MPKEPYSNSVDPKAYVRNLIVHACISGSDRNIRDAVRREVQLRGGTASVYDAAGGPARLTLDLAQIAGAAVTLCDSDPVYVEEARKVLTPENGVTSPVIIIHDDICSWRPRDPVDVVVTQGVLHHLEKGENGETEQFLANVHAMLAPDGILIISDEAFAPYLRANEPVHTERNRREAAAIWYSYVIATALRGAAEGGSQATIHQALADDECIIFMNDAFNVEPNPGQVSLIKDSVSIISTAAVEGEWELVKAHASALVSRLQSSILEGAETIPGRRGDYKGDINDMLETIQPWFTVVSVQTVGPVATIGGMIMLVVRKK